MEIEGNSPLKETCIICNIILTKKNTALKENKRYCKYNKIICIECFKDYYP